MSVREFIVQILINHLGRILEEDPFLFLKFQQAFDRKPDAFRRPKETKTELLQSPDKIIQWIRNSLKSHAKSGYQILVTEEEVLALVKRTTHCVYCGTRLRYPPFKVKGISRNLWAELDRRDGNQTTLTIGTVQIICRRCNWTKGSAKHDDFIAYIKRINHMQK